MFGLIVWTEKRYLAEGKLHARVLAKAMMDAEEKLRAVTADRDAANRQIARLAHNNLELILLWAAVRECGQDKRVRVLAEAGAEKCACVIVDLSKKDEKLLNLALNNPDGQGEFIDGIDEYIENLRNEIDDDSLMLDLRLMELEDGVEGLTDDDAIPEKVEPICKTGDLWLLGDHRLLCGDSTKAEDVERLMAGKKADMVFTDPPYGVDYEGGASNKKKREKLKGDANTDLYGPCCRQAFRVSTQKASLYLWHAGVKGIAAAAAAAAAAAGYEIRCELIWHKLKAHYGAFMAQYMQKHEPCYYCYKKGQVVQWFGPANEVTVWEVDQPAKNEYHPTQKPTALPERAIKNSSLIGQTVLDLFLGSGTTLIACEKMGRKCYGMEIEPHYGDVIIERWEDFTGDKAELAE